MPKNHPAESSLHPLSVITIPLMRFIMPPEAIPTMLAASGTA